MDENKRCNLEKTENGVRVCWGNHDKALGCEWEYFVSEGYSRRPEPLVRGMEIDIEAFAKDMFEVCHYPAPEYWKDQDENTKSRWRTNAEIIRDKAHVWLKEKDTK